MIFWQDWTCLEYTGNTICDDLLATWRGHWEVLKNFNGCLEHSLASKRTIVFHWVQCIIYQLVDNYFYAEMEMTNCFLLKKHHYNVSSTSSSSWCPCVSFNRWTCRFGFYVGTARCCRQYLGCLLMLSSTMSIDFGAWLCSCLCIATMPPKGQNNQTYQVGTATWQNLTKILAAISSIIIKMKMCLKAIKPGHHGSM